jgi:hypothetical protein
MTHYGLKLGDRVEHTAFGATIIGEVIDLPATDNNRARIRLDNGSETDVVAEWCRVMQAPNKTPAELAAEMLRMADLHPNFMWAVVMREGAEVILSCLENRSCS